MVHSAKKNMNMEGQIAPQILNRYFTKKNIYYQIFSGKVFKEILPIYSRYMTKDISELPVDVLSRIVSYKLEEPKYMRLKYNKKVQTNTK